MVIGFEHSCLKFFQRQIPKNENAGAVNRQLQKKTIKLLYYGYTVYRRHSPVTVLFTPYACLIPLKVSAC